MLMIFTKKILMVFCFGFPLSLIGTPANSAAINMNDGRWEITTQMEMADVPFPMPAMTYTTCLTKDDMIPTQNAEAEKGNCKMLSQKIHDNTVEWTVLCDSEQGKSTNTGTITYHGDSFEGMMHLNMPGMGAVKQKMTGKRIGNCD
jgi:leucyl aminopeptidase (aminopeptidase T)